MTSGDHFKVADNLCLPYEINGCHFKSLFIQVLWDNAQFQMPLASWKSHGPQMTKAEKVN